MNVERRVIEHDGCRIAYDVRGTGTPVLLIQGVGVHADGWLPQVEPLSAYHACLSFDNRGMGRSQPADRGLTVERMAGDARAILDAEGCASAHVVGHSLGGLVALRLALSAPERVRSLSLLCTFGDGRAAAPLTPRMIWTGFRARVGTRGMRRRGFLRLIMPAADLARADETDLADRLRPLFGHDLADQPPVVVAQLRAMRASNLTSRLAELAAIPALVVSGAHDPIAPPSVGRALAAGIPGARYVEYEDASHGLPIHRAERVNGLLREHLAAADVRWPLRDPSRPSDGSS